MLIEFAAGLYHFKEAILLSILLYVVFSVYKRRVSIPFRKLILLVIGTHFLFAFIFTVLQYFLWKGSPITLELLRAGLPPQTPLGMFEFARSILSADHGYFAYYSIMRFFFQYLVVGIFVAVLALLIEIWVRVKGSSVTRTDAATVIFCALLLSWPNVLLLVPFTLIALVVDSCFESLGIFKKPLTLQQIALVTTLFILVFGRIILEQFNLYTLLVL